MKWNNVILSMSKVGIIVTMYPPCISLLRTTWISIHLLHEADVHTDSKFYEEVKLHSPLSLEIERESVGCSRRVLLPIFLQVAARPWPWALQFPSRYRRSVPLPWETLNIPLSSYFPLNGRYQGENKEVLISVTCEPPK